ncbi:MAG: FAD-dependent oxidoreductase [Pseudomonadota bacterium]
MTRILPRHIETIVIGGGIVGCSVAYHLAKADRPVLLLERKQLTSGSTWHAAGLVSQFHGFPCVTRLASYGIELMQQLEAETGQATGFKKVGAIAVALNEARREELRRRMDVAIGQGIEVQRLNVEQLAEHWPLLNTDGIVEAIHFPNDGQTSPIDTTMALAKGARNAGAQIVENLEVTRLLTKNGKAIGVETPEGVIHSDQVVNCTGIWGRAFAESSGTHLPIQHNQHFYIVTDPIEGLKAPAPVLRIYDEQAYYKEDAGKLMIGFAELNGIAWDPDGGIPRDFEFDELPYPENHLDAVLEKCIDRVPALTEAGIRTFFNGPEGYTPDGRYYLGEDQAVENLYVAAGFNSSGIQNGPGAGMVLAEWIVKGYAPRDLIDVDVRRVQPFQADREYLLQRGPETLSETYAMHWPYKQRNTMRGLRLSPIHEQLEKSGAVFGESAGWERPMWYAPAGVVAEYDYGYNQTSWFKYWKAEHEAIRNDAGFIDLSPFCKIQVEGADAESKLQRICTNQIAVEPGRVVYTQWLNERAGIEADVTVARLDEMRFLVMTSAVTGLSDMAWLRKQISPDARVEISDITASQAVYGISGPRARALLSAYSQSDFSNQAFPFGTSQEIHIGEVSVRAQRISYTGECGWELFVNVDDATTVFEILMSSENAPSPRLVGFHAAESLRTEKAYRHWGHDIGYTDTPYESGLMFASQLQKQGGFIGLEALQKTIETGSQRRFIQLLSKDPDRFIYHNEPIFMNDQLVGAVTTGSYGHSLGAPVGLGWITLPPSMPLEAMGQQAFHILVAGEAVDIEVSLQPMYDPANERIRG